MTAIKLIRTALPWLVLPIALAACQSQPQEQAPPAATDTGASTQQNGGAAASPDTPPAAQPPAQAPPALTSTAGERPAPITPPAPAPARVEVTVPAGTEMSIELLDNLSSETATVETTVRGRLRRAVEAGGRTVFPAGATLGGVVTAVERPGRVKGRASLTVSFATISVNGERTAISTRPVTVEGESDTKGDATKIGVGAGVGAVVGGILGGGSGAAKGAAIGGAAGTGAVLATRGKDVELASGTTLSTSLTAAKTIELPR
jgi:hypothetical protein